MTQPVIFKAYIDHNGDGDFGDSLEDVSADLLGGSWSRGRSGPLEEYGAGQAQVTLDNQTGRYSPDNPSGPLYGLLRPGNALKITQTVGGNTYGAFYGDVTAIDEDREPGRAPVVRFAAQDAFGTRLARGSLRIPAQAEGSRVDEVLGVICDAMPTPWPAPLRSFDVAKTAFDTPFYVHRSTPAEALRLAARHELLGSLYIGAAGALTFHHRYYRSGLASLGAVTRPSRITLGRSLTDYVEGVEVTRAGILTDPGLSDVYFMPSVSGEGRLILPGDPATNPTVRANNTIRGEFVTGAKNVQTPVAVTDWTANSDIYGAGSDKSNQLSVYSFQSFGGGFELILQNLDQSNVYLRSLKVQATAIRRTEEDRTISVAVAGGVQSGRVLQVDLPFLDDVDVVRNYANWLASVHSTAQPRPLVGAPRKSATWDLVASVDLETKVTVQNTDGPFPTGLSADFIVSGVACQFANSRLPVYTWTLLHVDQVGGNFFTVGVSEVGGGDRIAF